MFSQIWSKGRIFLGLPVPATRGSNSVLGPLLGDIEVAELVDQQPVLRELGLTGRLYGLEGSCSAGRSVPELLCGGKEGCAQPIVVLCLCLQAADHVLLPVEGHETRPPVLPDPLPAGDAVAAQQRGQEHGARCEQRPGTDWLRAQPRESCVPVEVESHSLSRAPTKDSKLTRTARLTSPGSSLDG